MALISPITPLMRQYQEIKEKYPDILLLFQVGDFYELFFEDAQKAAPFLGITLTARGKHNGEPIPLCGVPVHAAEHYISKLIKGGFRVALCNQLEEAIPGKVVDRGVTQVFTPGTLTDSALLDEKSASYLLSFFPHGDSWGLLFGELLTAQLFATVLPLAYAHKALEGELVRFFPDEILIPATKEGKSFESYFNTLGYCTTLLLPNSEEEGQAKAWTESQLSSDSIHTVKTHHAVRHALYNMYAYLRKNQESALAHFKTVTLYQPEDFLLIDAATQRNLELVKNMHDGSRKNTLYELMDGAACAMGSRTIKKWMLRPLVKKETIMQRQDAVQAFLENLPAMQALRRCMRDMGDLERVVGRIALRRAGPNDYLLLTHALHLIPDIERMISGMTLPLLMLIKAHLGNFRILAQLLRTALHNDPAHDWIINEGFDQRLDSMRERMNNSSALMIGLEQEEQRKTGINSLKVGYNQVHGYYIEVTKTHFASVPDRYVRYQTLVGKERYTTVELKQLEAQVVSARMESVALEKELFETIKREVDLHVPPLRKMAQALAHLDALMAFAHSAYQYGYVRPVFNEERDILIVEGRHPVIEQKLQHLYITNNTELTDAQSLWIITGPNMGGKSTYLRQVALICIMAQCGSFVPAKSVNVALLDRIFTRIGAGDNVAEGKSTFLVEMEETALLCSKATRNSLIILDEVGRGTSTFDGLAIAQAVVEYVYTTVQARCLFATHYHELTLLQQQFPGIVSYYAASKKHKGGIVLLYKIIQGIADGSFGIEVAKLAGLPLWVVERASVIVSALQEQGHQGGALVPVTEQKEIPTLHVCLDEEQSRHLAKTLKEFDLNECSPKQALDFLWKLREQL